MARQRRDQRARVVLLRAGFACDDPAYSCARVLAPGDHTTITFRPELTFTVGTGWVNTLDRERALTLHDNESPGHVADDWTRSCPGSLGPAAFLITDSGEPPNRVRWIDDQRTTRRIVDVAGETVPLYLETSPSPADLAAVNAELQPVVDTFRFAPSG
jgi:hypothetical protein